VNALEDEPPILPGDVEDALHSKDVASLLA
jgi:hypothetical protein